ncbi:methyltransferase family protein [Paenibacillus sp. sgz500958]|uniref:methyltransferase family protein n=1 Tax=Paenibacillus sp. sgz500958 TaxID=3242475 RepID=UPI0036D2C6BC
MKSFMDWYLPIYSFCFIFFAIILRSWLQYKKTGIHPVTFQRNSDSVHDYVGYWFKIVIALLFAHVLLQHFLPLPKISLFDNTVSQCLGVFLTLGSLLLILWAQKTMGNAWRIGIDKEHATGLVSKGPFQWSRNPIFLGMLTSSFGIALIVPTYLMWSLFTLTWLLINIQVRLEEQYLQELHQEFYSAYKSATGRFLPKL